MLGEAKPRPSNEIAELIVGLMFAAHKNPAIAAAQTLIFLHCGGPGGKSSPELTSVLSEVRSTASPASILKQAPTLTRCITEVLRITAHSIGALVSRRFCRGLMPFNLLVLTRWLSAGAVRKVVAPKGFEIPTTTGDVFHLAQGEYVGFSHILPNLDPSSWGPAPADFSPSRLLSGPVEDEYAMTTFSHGLHRCPGKRLALLQVAFVVSTVLCEYSLRFATPVAPLDFERATLAQRRGAVMTTASPV